jgi:hypothetical protein
MCGGNLESLLSVGTATHPPVGTRKHMPEGKFVGHRQRNPKRSRQICAPAAHLFPFPLPLSRRSSSTSCLLNVAVVNGKEGRNDISGEEGEQ